MTSQQSASFRDRFRDTPVHDGDVFSRYFYDKMEFLQSIDPHVKEVIFKGNQNFIAVARKGMGTSIAMEMAILRAMCIPAAAAAIRASGSEGMPLNTPSKILFISSLNERYQQRLHEWKLKYESVVLPGWSRVLKVGELSESTIRNHDIFCTTPYHFDAFCRRFLVPLTPQAAQEMSQFSLVLIEDIHLVGNSQDGLLLEFSVVSRLKMLSRLPDMTQCMLSKLRFGGTVDSESVSPTAINTIKAWMNATATHVCFNYDKDGGPAPNGCLPLPLHDITTLVKGYPSLSNDFLFNRRLNDNLWSLVKEYGREKSILVICTSRNSAAEAALSLKGEATAAVHDLKTQGKVGLNEFSWHPGSVYWTDRPSVLVRDQSHWETLQRAALQIENLDLQRVIPHGIGFSHAGLSWGDRCLVKALFESGDLRIVCSTNGTSGTMPPTSFSHTSTHHTLLPAHTKSITKQLLLILKGTKRYVSNYRATQSAGYSEADGYAVINIIRDAVTNLFSIPDVPALAVIMTEQKNVHHYQALLQSPKTKEEGVSSWIIKQSSRDHDHTPIEHSFLSECLCTEICIGTVTDDKTTRDWLASLLFPLTTTMQTLNHSNTDLQSHLFQRLIDHPPAPLVQAIVDVHCGTTRVYPQRGGTILSKYGLRYETMMAIMRLSQTHQNSKSPFIEYSYSKPSHTSCLPKGKGCDKDLTRVEDILWLISNSPEVLEDCNITVRRTEKQVLNAMNASPEQMYRMTKPASTTTQRPGDLQNKLVKASRKLPRITTPSQKVFVLLVRVMSTRGQCLGDSNLGLRSDTARITKAAGRLIAAIAEFYSDDGLDNSNTNMFALNRAACTLREALSWRQGEQ